MPYDWSRDIAIAPDGVLQRLGSAINRRKKRAFGVLKTENEYVGVIGDDAFEIWERQKRAIHARGQVRGRPGGTRVEVRFVVPTRTRVLIGVFFVLYIAASIGIASQPPQSDVSPQEVGVAVAGGVVLAALFAASARSQRADLRAFLDRVWGGLPRI